MSNSKAFDDLISKIHKKLKMSEESITERIKLSGEILNTKFEIIDNRTLENSKTSLKDFFYDFFAMNQGQSEE